MAKIVELIDAAAKVEVTKALAESVRTDLGALAGVEAKDLVTRVTTSEAKVTELTGQVKDLDDKAKGADALKATVERYESEKRASLLNKAFADAAAKNGVNPKAIASAQRLVRLDGVKVDIEKGEVIGLSKEIFDRLKTSDPVLFEVAGSPAAPVVNANPAMPASAGKPAPALNVPGPIGFFAKRN